MVIASVISLHKYPRTPHVDGSRLQPGDEDLASVPFRTLAGRYLVVEEKLDGANTGLSFDEAGRLRRRVGVFVFRGGYHQPTQAEREDEELDEPKLTAVQPA